MAYRVKLLAAALLLLPLGAVTYGQVPSGPDPHPRRGFHRPPLEANDPALGTRRETITEDIQPKPPGTWVEAQGPVIPSEPPTPFPPPQIPTFGVNLGSPSDPDPHPLWRGSGELGAVSFDDAITAYLGSIWVTLTPTGTPRLHDSCLERVEATMAGPEARLATEMLPLSIALYEATGEARRAFLGWFAVDGPGKTPAELTAAYHRAIRATLDADAIRPYVAGAVIMAGLPRGEDLMVEPGYLSTQEASCTTGRCDCAACDSGTCDCQTYNPAIDDCAPKRLNCSTWDPPIITRGRTAGF